MSDDNLPQSDMDKSVDPKELFERSLPDLQTLVSLAAQPRFADLSNKAALDGAITLWREAKAVLEKELEIANLRNEHYCQPIANANRPKKWPVDFDELLSSIMPRDNHATRYNKFRRFLLHELRVARLMNDWGHDCDDGTRQVPADPSSEEEREQVNGTLERHRKTQFGPKEWEHLALRFLRWWPTEKSENKRKGGRSRAAKGTSQGKPAS